MLAIRHNSYHSIVTFATFCRANFGEVLNDCQCWSRLGLSTGQVGLVLDPTRTQPTDVGWKVEGPETDRRRHSIESVLGSGGVQVGSVSVESHWILQTSPESSKNSSEFAKTQQICTKNRQNQPGSPRISPNLTKYGRDLAWISSNVARSHQISLGSPRMSPDLIKSRLNVAGSHQISVGSPRILPDLYITSVGSGGLGFGEENPPLDPPTSSLGRRNSSLTVGVVGSGSCRLRFGRVARVGWVPSWVGHPQSWFLRDQ